MKKTLVIIIVLLFIFKGNSQGLGYLGKQFSVIYSPSVGFPHISNVNRDAGTPHFNFNHNIKLEYLLLKKMTFGLSYNLINNKAKNNTDYLNYKDFTAYHKFVGHSLGVYAKFYRTSTIAPIGKYFRLGMKFYISNLNDLVYQKAYSTTISKVSYKAYDFGLNMAYGRNWILFDNVLFGLEGYIGVPIMSFIGIHGLLGEHHRHTDESIIIPIANRFNLSNEFLKISLNIGFLAF